MAGKTDAPDELRRVPRFSGLDRQELALLAKLVKDERYAAGTEIVKAGRSGHGLYIHREGQHSAEHTSERP